MDLSSMSPTKRMFLGLALMVIGAIGSLSFILATIWLCVVIGILQTITMYLAIMFFTVFYRIYTRHGRRDRGFHVVQHWDTDAADEAGSTARAGFPHDPFNIVPRRRYSGFYSRPYDPNEHPWA